MAGEESNTYQFLTFMLEKEKYGFNVLKIKEVLEVPQITKIPKTLPFMAGVINLRGGIIPLVDLRNKFEFQEIVMSESTSIIIVEVQYDEETILIGALVDAVKKVIKLHQEDLEPPPKVGMSIDTKFIQALGKNDNQLVIILNSDNLFSKEELTHFTSVTDSPVAVGSGNDKHKNKEEKIA